MFVKPNVVIDFTMNCNFMSTELTLNPPEGIVAGPINEENFFEWEALITYVSFIFFYYSALFCFSLLYLKFDDFLCFH